MERSSTGTTASPRFTPRQIVTVGRPHRRGVSTTAHSDSSSSVPTRLAMLAPQSHAIQTIGPSTPASRSPQWWWSVKKASSSASRLTAAIPRRRLRAALAAVLVKANAPELKLVHDLLDSWWGIGLVIVGMAHHGFQVSLGDHGAGRWIAVFFRGSGGQEGLTAEGTAQEPTPWRAVQRAAWEAIWMT